MEWETCTSWPAIEKTELDGFTATIYQEEDAWSPAEWDNVGTLIQSRDYAIRGVDDYKEWSHAIERFEEPEGFCRYMTLTGQAVACIPVYLQNYNEGMSGFLYATRENLVKCCGEDATREDAISALEAEAKTWQQYFEGDVYSYSVKDDNGELVDAVGGFYGFDYAKTEAESALAYAVKEARAEDAPAIEEALKERS